MNVHARNCNHQLFAKMGQVFLVQDSFGIEVGEKIEIRKKE